MANTIGGGLPPFNIPSGYKESPPKKQDEERINQIKDKCKEYGLNISENPDPDEVAEIEGKLLKFNQIEAEHQKYGISIPKEKFKDSKEVEKMEKGLEVLKRGGITPEKLNELKEQIGIKVDDAGKGSSSSAKSAGSAKKYEGSRQAGSTAKTAKEAAKVEHGFGTTAGALAANKALSTGDEGLHKQTIQPQIRAKAGELTGQRNQILGSLKTDEKENLISSLNEGTGTAGAFGGAFGLPQMLGGDGSIIQMSAGLGLADPMAGMGKLGKTQITVSNDDSGAGQIDKYIGNYDKKISEKSDMFGQKIEGLKEGQSAAKDDQNTVKDAAGAQKDVIEQGEAAKRDDREYAKNYQDLMKASIEIDKIGKENLSESNKWLDNRVQNENNWMGTVASLASALAAASGTPAAAAIAAALSAAQAMLQQAQKEREVADRNAKEKAKEQKDIEDYKKIQVQQQKSAQALANMNEISARKNAQEMAKIQESSTNLSTQETEKDRQISETEQKRAEFLNKCLEDKKTLSEKRDEINQRTQGKEAGGEKEGPGSAQAVNAPQAVGVEGAVGISRSSAEKGEKEITITLNYDPENLDRDDPDNKEDNSNFGPFGKPLGLGSSIGGGIAGGGGTLGIGGNRSLLL